MGAVKTYEDLTKVGAIPGGATAEMRRWGEPPSPSKNIVEQGLPELRETILDVDRITGNPVVVAFSTPSAERVVVHAGVDPLGNLLVDLDEAASVLPVLRTLGQGTQVLAQDKVREVTRVRSIYTGDRLTHYLFEVD